MVERRGAEERGVEKRREEKSRKDWDIKETTENRARLREEHGGARRREEKKVEKSKAQAPIWYQETL